MEEDTRQGTTLRDVIQAILPREALENKIDTLRADLRLLRDYHLRLAERATTTEREVAEQPPAVTNLINCLATMEGKVKTLKLRAEDAENNTIRLVGLPEKLEGNNMIDFLENLVRSQFSQEGLLPFSHLKEHTGCEADHPHWEPHHDLYWQNYYSTRSK
ncbi:hypothetical protein NDU88_006718 [Pleurodeles waltl]|uniref:Uncharacterized protein n=1 Tax=Pleurodeles waltl TaxID=8319 RepID=A0AAV7SQG4_PLEWA|nr:hypothetical protein NDU88_006718 [Pleurodeles waltl]